MKLGKVLKNSLLIAAKHRDIFLVFSFVYAILIFAALFLGTLGGVTLVLSVFLFLPVQFSFYIIAKKMYENKPIIPQDFYFGFRSMLTSLVLGSKMIFKGFLNGLLVFIGFLLLGGVALSGYLINNYPALIDFIMKNSANINAISTQLDAYPNIVNIVLIIYALASLAAAIIYILSASKLSLAPLILFEAPFDINSALKMSNDISRKDRKGLILMYGFYLLILIAIIIGVLSISNYFFNAGTFDDLVLIALIFIMFSILIAPLNIMFVISKTGYYQQYAKAEVIKIIEDLKNSMIKTKESDK